MMVRAALTAAFLATLLLGPGRALGQEPDFQKFIEKYGTPGPEHKNLEPLVGTWNVTAKFYLKPGAEPVVSKGTAERHWMLGKRFLVETYKGEAAGQPFTGMGWSGYNRYEKKYLATWVDTMSTGIALSTGTYDPKKKTFTYFAEMDDPFTGKKVKNRDVLRILSKDEHVMEMYRAALDGSNEMKVMELHCVRAEAKTKKES